VSDNETALRAEGLWKTYDRRSKKIEAVRGLDLSVPKGEFVCLLGFNGAGKTTTIGMFTTRIVPTAGRAFVHGIDVSVSPAAVRARIGVVSQGNSLDRSLNVLENLEYHGRFFRLPRKEATARGMTLLERFDLADRAKAQVTALSGGLARRVMLARALLHRPDVLFLDEPTVGLDPQSREKFWNILTELHAEGRTIVLTTHNLEEAEQLCQRIYILNQGKLLTEGTAEELRARVGIDRTIVMTVDRAADHFARDLKDLPPVRDVEATGDTIRVQVNDMSGVMQALAAAANRTGVSVTDIATTPPSLQSVFLAIASKGRS
jgi:ABC-2 type transport system ATP-binding protein